MNETKQGGKGKEMRNKKRAKWTECEQEGRREEWGKGRKGEESQHPGPGQAAECRVERLFPHSLPQKRAEAQLKEAAAAANSRKGTRNGGRAMQLYGKNNEKNEERYL